MTVLLSVRSSFDISEAGTDTFSGASDSDFRSDAVVSVSDDSASCAGTMSSASLSVVVLSVSCYAVSASLKPVSDDSAVSVSSASVFSVFTS